MILTTTETVPGRAIAECLGIVTAEAIVQPGMMETLTLSTEGRLQGRRELLFAAREEALQKLADHAAARGADAVVAISLDYEVIDTAYGTLLAAAAGTAVKLGG